MMMKMTMIMILMVIMWMLELTDRSGRLEDPQPSLTKSEPPSPGHSCYSEETRAGAESWQEEATAGCCSLQQTAPDLHNLISAPPTTSKEPLLSNCVKNFMSWMAEKAEKGTSAFLDSLPSLSKEDFHIVMIGLDGAGKTTALYRLKFDQERRPSQLYNSS